MGSLEAPEPGPVACLKTIVRPCLRETRFEPKPGGGGSHAKESTVDNVLTLVSIDVRLLVCAFAAGLFLKHFKPADP